MKMCRHCGETKELALFPVSKRNKDGHTGHCRECDKERKRKSNERIREADPDAWTERQRAYVAKYKEKHPERVREQERRQNLKYKFNMTAERYDEMLMDQNGLCAVCEQPPRERRLAVDHDRSCCPGNVSCGNCIRKLLCSNCNTALGLLKDNMEYIMKIAKYVEDYK